LRAARADYDFGFAARRFGSTWSNLYPVWQAWPDVLSVVAANDIPCASNLIGRWGSSVTLHVRDLPSA